MNADKVLHILYQTALFAYTLNVNKLRKLHLCTIVSIIIKAKLFII